MENQPQQKLLRYLDDYLESNKFQLKIKILREKFGIPQNGFPISQERELSLSQNNNFINRIYLPEKLKEIPLRNINLAIKEAIKDFSLENNGVFPFFRLYLFYNKKFDFPFVEKLPHDETNLCGIERVKFDLNEYSSAIPPEYAIKILKQKYDKYPVSIKIHPSASSKDLIIFIKKNWLYIKSLLEEYEDKKSKVGKSRKRNPQIKERNQFIYENRYLSYKEISKKVRKKFPDISESIDQGSIGKIISIETKRRN